MGRDGRRISAQVPGRRDSYKEFCRRDAELWRGLREERVREILNDIPYHPGVEETLEALRDEGVETVIVSTGLAMLVERVSHELGITRAIANELVVEEGVLSGDIRINVQHDDHERAHRGVTPEAGPDDRAPSLSGIPRRELHKGEWVRQILKEMDVGKEEAAAVGDGEGDLAMFEAVGLAIGYHPSQGILPVLDHALHNGSFLDVLEVLRGHR